jgi:hypothetical protein
MAGMAVMRAKRNTLSCCCAKSERRFCILGGVCRSMLLIKQSKHTIGYGPGWQYRR